MIIWFVPSSGRVRFWYELEAECGVRARDSWRSPCTISLKHLNSSSLGVCLLQWPIGSEFEVAICTTFLALHRKSIPALTLMRYLRSKRVKRRGIKANYSSVSTYSKAWSPEVSLKLPLHCHIDHNPCTWSWFTVMVKWDSANRKEKKQQKAKGVGTPTHNGWNRQVRGNIRL